MSLCSIILGLKAWPQAGQGKMKISVHLLRSPWLNAPPKLCKTLFKKWMENGWNMLTRIKSGFKALILLQIFLTNSSSCKCKLLMLTNLSGLWKDMDSWTRSNLALSTFIGISVLITRLVKTSPLTIRDSLFLPSFRGFMSLF